ncbi:hypothetical protein [Microbacterium sp. ABRD28]|uniref:hypothetical protein n=1 Tax=Microbacterium sp. ABRD28 TaxID=2268461 RepID=UPI000F54D9AC|nr:hypothetical protein [Microbacterium sp. ABRD28]AZC14933.1 hypothetical protein DT073_15485 [Microbacterium sp. ABRD28]
MRRPLLFTTAALTVTALHFAVVTVWPASLLVTVLCLVGAFVFVLRLPEEHPWTLGLLAGAFAVVVHGTMIVLEQLARFPTAWLHAGYTAHVMEHHDVLPSLGARFSWPAFFVVTASAFSPAGDSVPEPVLRFAPLFFVLAMLPAILVIARRCVVVWRGSWRAPWLAVWFFPLIDWFGQDYFAPQSLALLLGLSIIAIVLTLSDRPPTLWTTRDGVLRRGGLLWPRRPGIRDAALVRARIPDALLLVGSVVVLCAAVAMTHQLTPFVIAVQLAVLWYAGRLPWMLPAWIVGVTALVWVSWGASDFWIPFIADVFGGVGDPVGNLSAGIVERTGGSAEHQTVVAVRLGFTLAVVLAAAGGVIAEYVRDRRIELSLPLLAAAPGFLLFAQSYGGEGVLRVMVFATPFLAMLVTKLFITRRGLGRAAAAAVVIVSVACVPPFLVARYGNEPFERVRADEIALAGCLYDRAPAGSTILSVSPHLAWQFRDIADHLHLSANERVFDAETADDLRARLEQTPRPRYLIFTEPQLQFVVRSLGAPATWPTALQRELAADPAMTVVCENSGGVVYRVGGAG